MKRRSFLSVLGLSPIISRISLEHIPVSEGKYNFFDEAAKRFPDIGEELDRGGSIIYLVDSDGEIFGKQPFEGFGKTYKWVIEEPTKVESVYISKDNGEVHWYNFNNRGYFYSGETLIFTVDFNGD